VQCRGLPLPFLFRTIHREKNYIVNQMQDKQKKNGRGKGERKKSVRTLCHLSMHLK